jgi:hypothetical protein
VDAAGGNVSDWLMRYVVLDLIARTDFALMTSQVAWHRGQTYSSACLGATGEGAAPEIEDSVTTIRAIVICNSVVSAHALTSISARLARSVHMVDSLVGAPIVVLRRLCAEGSLAKSCQEPNWILPACP